MVLRINIHVQALPREKQAEVFDFFVEFLSARPIFLITTIEVLGWRGHDATNRTSAEKLLGCMDEIPP